MIIRVKRENKKQKLIRVFLAILLFASIFGYYYYHIVLQTKEDNANYLKRVEQQEREKKISRKLQRSILDESDKVISLLGANNIDRLKFYKKDLIFFIGNDKFANILKIRYGNLASIVSVNDMWKVKLNLEKFLTIKQKEEI